MAVFSHVQIRLGNSNVLVFYLYSSIYTKQVTAWKDVEKGTAQDICRTLFNIRSADSIEADAGFQFKRSCCHFIPILLLTLDGSCASILYGSISHPLRHLSQSARVLPANSHVGANRLGFSLPRLLD